MPIFGMHDYLYVCNVTFSSIDLLKLAILVPGKSTLNTLIGINLLSLLYLFLVACCFLSGNFLF